MNPTQRVPFPLLLAHRSYRQGKFAGSQELWKHRRFREEAPVVGGAEIFDEGPRATPDNRHLAIAGRSLPVVLFNRPLVAAGSVRMREIPAWRD